MKQRVRLAVISAAAAVVVLLGVASVSTVAQAADKLKVAAVLPGAINDQSWNSLGYQGLQSIKKEFGAEIAYSENVQPADQIDAIRDYVRRGFNVIFVHGGQFEDAANTVAQEAPDVTFFVTAGTKGNGKNLFALDAARDQMMYGLAYLASKLSKSGKIGYVTSLEGVPAVVASVCGFRAGVAAGKSGSKVSVIYLPDMEDVVRAREAVLTLVGNGADFVVGDLNRGIQGVLDVSKEKSILTTGRVADHIKIYPQGVVTAAIEDWANMYPSAVRMKQAGKLGPIPLFLGVDQGFYYTYTGQPGGALSDKLNPIVPKDVSEAWSNEMQAVSSGAKKIEHPEGCDKAGSR
jgi:basic membrane protein A